MEQHAKHPLRDRNEQKPASQRQIVQQPVTSVDGTCATKPIDGSQYLDVIEEQEYADRRPSAEEQKPRFSYLNKKEPEEEDDEQSE